MGQPWGGCPVPLLAAEHPRARHRGWGLWDTPVGNGRWMLMGMLEVGTVGWGPVLGESEASMGREHRAHVPALYPQPLWATPAAAQKASKSSLVPAKASRGDGAAAPWLLLSHRLWAAQGPFASAMG